MHCEADVLKIHQKSDNLMLRFTVKASIFPKCITTVHQIKMNCNKKNNNKKNNVLKQNIIKVSFYFTWVRFQNIPTGFIDTIGHEKCNCVCGSPQGEGRMVRMQFDGSSRAEALQECSSAVEKLREYTTVSQDDALQASNQSPAEAPASATQVGQFAL